MDAGWHYGSLTTAVEPPAAEPAGADVAALLDAAEEIVNSAAPGILEELDMPRRGIIRRKPGSGKKRKKKK